MSKAPLLQVQGLTVGFRDRRGSTVAVSGIDLHVSAEERVALVGASGSGKSLTAMALLGLTTPGGQITGGRVEINGRDMLRLDAEEQRRLRGAVISLIPQEAEAALNPVLSVAAHFREVVRSHAGTCPDLRVRSVSAELDAVGLGNASIPRRYPHELSGGQKQRVLIALALFTRPSLLIADEPTSSLDLVTQASILELLIQRCSEHSAAMVVITHDLEVAAAVSSRLLVMSAGEIVEHGPTKVVMSEPKHPATRRLVGANPGTQHPGPSTLGDATANRPSSSP